MMKMIAVSMLALGLATSAMAQSSGGTQNSGDNGSSTNGQSSGGTQNSGDNGGSQPQTNNNGQNAGASGGDANDCQRREAGNTKNPSKNNTAMANDPANACK